MVRCPISASNVFCVLWLEYTWTLSWGILEIARLSVGKLPIHLFCFKFLVYCLYSPVINTIRYSAIYLSVQIKQSIPTVSSYSHSMKHKTQQVNIPTGFSKCHPLYLIPNRKLTKDAKFQWNYPLLFISYRWTWTAISMVHAGSFISQAGVEHFEVLPSPVGAHLES